MTHLMNYKAIGIIITISCSMTYAMELEDFLPWFLVKRIYPDKTKEATQACQAANKMLRTTVMLSLNPELQPYKDELIDHLGFVIKICDARKELIADGTFESKEIPMRKLFRLGDYRLVESYAVIEHHFNLLQKFQRNNETDAGSENRN